MSRFTRMPQVPTEMSVAARLAGFAVLLLVVFGGALLAGGALGPEPAARSAGPARHDGHPGESHSPEAGASQTPVHAGTTGEPDGEQPAAVRGLAVSEDGLTLILKTPELRRGRPSELRFAIVRADGRPLRDFELEHEKRMHVIVVRRDGENFQHLHPERDDSGTWSTPLILADAGAYRVFADFKSDGRGRTLAADLAVDGDADYQPVSAPSTTARIAGGYAVSLDAEGARAGREATLRFTITRNGQAVHPEPYLGAGGHLVALRESDLAYLHVHPGNHGTEGHGGTATHADAVAFASGFPSAGRYRLYLQFRHAGRVRTAGFIQEVAR